MGKPDPTNPSTEPQDDKKQSGTDPIVRHQNPGQQGQVVIHRKIRDGRGSSGSCYPDVTEPPS